MVTKGNFEKETESLIINVENNVIKTNYIKPRITQRRIQNVRYVKIEMKQSHC